MQKTVFTRGFAFVLAFLLMLCSVPVFTLTTGAEGDVASEDISEEYGEAIYESNYASIYYGNNTITLVLDAENLASILEERHFDREALQQMLPPVIRDIIQERSRESIGTLVRELYDTGILDDMNLIPSVEDWVRDMIPWIDDPDAYFAEREAELIIQELIGFRDTISTIFGGDLSVPESVIPWLSDPGAHFSGKTISEIYDELIDLEDTVTDLMATLDVTVESVIPWIDDPATYFTGKTSEEIDAEFARIKNVLSPAFDNNEDALLAVIPWIDDPSGHLTAIQSSMISDTIENLEDTLSPYITDYVNAGNPPPDELNQWLEDFSGGQAAEQSKEELLDALDTLKHLLLPIFDNQEDDLVDVLPWIDDPRSYFENLVVEHLVGELSTLKAQLLPYFESQNIDIDAYFPWIHNLQSYIDENAYNLINHELENIKASLLPLFNNDEEVVLSLIPWLNDPEAYFREQLGLSPTDPFDKTTLLNAVLDDIGNCKNAIMQYVRDHFIDFVESYLGGDIKSGLRTLILDVLLNKIDVIRLNDYIIYTGESFDLSDPNSYTFDHNAIQAAILNAIPTVEMLKTVSAGDEILHYDLAATGAEFSLQLNLHVVLSGDCTSLNGYADRLNNTLSYLFGEDGSITADAHLNQRFTDIYTRVLASSKLTTGQKLYLQDLFTMNIDDLILILENKNESDLEEILRTFSNKASDLLGNQSNKVEQVRSLLVRILKAYRNNVSVTCVADIYRGNGVFDIHVHESIDTDQWLTKISQRLDLLDAWVDYIRKDDHQLDVDLTVATTNFYKVSYADSEGNILYATFLPSGTDLAFLNQHSSLTGYGQDGWYNGEDVVTAMPAKDVVLYEMAHTHTVGEWITNANQHWHECGICGERLDEAAHAYDNDHDTTCNVCDFERDPIHAWVWMSDADGHWQECVGCDAKTDVTAHQFDNDHDTVCDICGFTREPVHTWEWKFDASGHWQECTGCDAKTDVTAHKFDNDHDTVCDTCKFSREPIHTYDPAWKYNNANHWHECACGDYTELAPHTLVSESDDTYHWQRCTVCGVIVNKTAHSLEWKANGANHWQVCTECGVKLNNDAHTFVMKSDETSHWMECSVCGVRKLTIAHTYETKYDANGHWQECSACGHSISVESHTLQMTSDNTSHWEQCECGYKTTAQTHVFDNDHDTDCNVCGAHRNPIHNFSTEWTSDENGHWHECACGAQLDAATHVYDDDTDTTCNICGYVRTLPVHEHNFGIEWKSDANGHWQECTCGEKSEVTAHVYDNDADTTCNVCGYERTIHVHDFGSEWVYNDDSHWYECACGEKTDLHAHVFKDNSDTTCDVCGYERTIETGAVTTPTETEKVTTPVETETQSSGSDSTIETWVVVISVIPFVFLLAIIVAVSVYIMLNIYKGKGVHKSHRK